MALGPTACSRYQAFRSSCLRKGTCATAAPQRPFPFQATVQPLHSCLPDYAWRLYSHTDTGLCNCATGSTAAAAVSVCLSSGFAAAGAAAVGDITAGLPQQGDSLRLRSLLRSSRQELLVEAGHGHGGGNAVGRLPAVEHGGGNAERMEPRGSFRSCHGRQAQLEHVLGLHPRHRGRAFQRRHITRQPVL